MIINNSKYNQSWETKTLNELGTFKRGKSKHRPRNDRALFENGIYPLIQTGEIKEANLLINNHNNSYNEFGLKQSKLWPKNTLCITIAANIAETAILNYPMCFPDSVVGFIAYEKESSELFMHYVFTYIKRAIQNVASGSIQDNINIDFLTSLNFKIPNKGIQDIIAKVLSDLDAKIELNNKINAELEAMTKTLYDYWFVQFDFPDANGKPYKTSGGRMVWNGELKKEIPFGWDVLDLIDIANITMGQSPPGESYNEYGNGTVFYQGCTDFGNRFPTIRKFTTSPTRFAKQGDILLSVRAPVGTMNIAKEDCCIGRGLASLNSKDNCIAYLFGVMVNLKQIFDRRNVDGTTFGSITKDDLFSLKVIKPSKEILLKFDKIVNPCFEQQNKLEQENQELASLRDWLLPMLMNGQVSVGEIAKDYVEKDEVLGMVAEKQSAYGNDKKAVDSLLESINYDYEVAVVVLLTRQRMDRTYGKKYIHKMFSNIKFLEDLPVFKDLKFQENHWGMYCPTLTRTIDNQKFIYFESVNDEISVINFNYKRIKEVSDWMKRNDNRDFVLKVEKMLSIYQKPLIDKNMDRIELLNTVLECINVLETYNFDPIWHKMKHWKMQEDGYATKADKFKPEETRMMIDLIKDLN